MSKAQPETSSLTPLLAPAAVLAVAVAAGLACSHLWLALACFCIGFLFAGKEQREMTNMSRSSHAPRKSSHSAFEAIAKAPQTLLQPQEPPPAVAKTAQAVPVALVAKMRMLLAPWTPRRGDAIGLASKPSRCYGIPADRPRSLIPLLWEPI